MRYLLLGPTMTLGVGAERLHHLLNVFEAGVLELGKPLFKACDVEHAASPCCEVCEVAGVVTPVDFQFGK
jgi:hypothetical protein